MVLVLMVMTVYECVCVCEGDGSSSIAWRSVVLALIFGKLYNIEHTVCLQVKFRGFVFVFTLEL